MYFLDDTPCRTLLVAYFCALNILQLYTLIAFSIKEKVSCICKWLQMAVGMSHNTGLLETIRFGYFGQCGI